ncbi:NAD-dependent epimerase/dehydratase family protein [Gryllotalpicola reticulitermitis]|uniref:NAD-dependent epimerase/dehydratase family protein n=1 Tax=Gryllotalpicola reticulitermitis TaxID=1184153 RepID=A0ABV8Q4F0_9MICO
MTGGTGFVGSHVVPRLLADGHDVTVLARSARRAAIYEDVPRVSIVRGSLEDDEVVSNALAGHDALVHIALGRGATPVERVLADTVPSVRLFEAAAQRGVSHLVHTSTVGVYEHRPGRYGDADPTRPTHSYGATKAAVENYAFAIADEYGVRANIIRPGYTFGAPELAGAPIQSMPELPEIARQAAGGDTITVTRNAGLQFIAAADLAAVYSAVLASESLNRRTFTALSPRFITWATIAGWAQVETGSASRVVIADEGVELAALTFDVSAIEREFGLSFEAEPALRAHLRYLANL